jgi:predicted MFS family arabinose efflux permease
MSSETDISWPRIILIYALGVFAAMAVSQAVPIIGLIAGELHPQSQAQAGLIISLPSLVVALGALLVGWIVDRTGAKPILIIGAIILAAGDIAASMAGSIQSLLTARVIEGLGYVGMAVAAVTLLSRTTSGNRRIWSLALWSSFVPMSFVVPFLTSGPIFAAHNWRLAFEYHAVALLLLTLLGAFALPRGLLKGEGARSKGLGLVLKSPWPWILGISFGAAACIQSGIVATLNSYWPAHFHQDATNVPLNSAIGMVVNIIGCLLVGRLISFKIPVWFIGIAGSVIAAVAALAMFLAPLSYSTEVVVFWIFTFGCGLLVGLWVLLPRVAPSPAATGATSGLVTSLTLLGVLVGSPAAFSVVFAPVATPIIIFVVGSIVVGLIALPIWLGRTGTSHA